MPPERLLKCEVGLQTVFGTPATPTIQLPYTADYENRDQWRNAPYDAGSWTPTGLRAKMQTECQCRMRGAAIFELLPVFWSSGYDKVTPSGTYLHTYNVSPSAPGNPKPLTAYVGAKGVNLGASGPAVILPDLYLRSWRLDGSVTGEKTCNWEAELFGTQVNDNNGAGTAFANVNLPTTPELLKVLLASFNLADASTTGGVFTTMTAVYGSLLDWELNATTGLAPAYSGDGNTLSFTGLRFVAPAHTLRLTIRLSSANFALIYRKYATGTYQELQLTLNGSGGRSLDIKMTGLFTECRSVHARRQDELVLEATFTAETPYFQTTTPHYLTLAVNSSHNWT
ncbi:MAG: hypothetical protein N2383_03365 [Caldilineales bacterium]|nr:hypothetical protein [Caldilineales bacterium]